MKNLFVYGIIICLFSSCLEKNDPKKLTNTKWELIELPGLTLPATTKATLFFADSLKISGKSFCNSYGGKVEVKDQKIALKDIISTRMFCQETDAAERAYVQAINQVTDAKINENELQLLNGDKKLLVFKKLAN
ncbi:META domain-containing protein [Pedobacter sp. CFBP9032]|uniref:META domain-containing protein n=1 Tax=Pedobacter sp. CFBP9032 TaxID=3096539 RepID=UPI002A69AFEB|nr:META domain-containing protein [Pedobacter sp. CFBP9032]MDY0905720.1 META domain-containing protein [Pedobacter sp. CFBP9032]